MGPLAGIRVLELAGLGPGPFAGMMLADLGADVVCLDRPGARGPFGALPDPLRRGRRLAELDLKQPTDVRLAQALAGRADVLIEGFRPGVVERLGLGPQDCTAANPRLVYARMTGWGQSGPRAPDVGHDINYLALAGVLHQIGPAGGPPIPPLNLVGDFGGGGMLVVVGILAALLERAGSGRGQVVDAAMVDGAALLSAMMFGLRAGGRWSDERGTNLLDGGAPFYCCYRAADGGYLAVGALEPQFYAALLTGLGLADEPLPAQYDERGWPVLRERFGQLFAGRTRAEWVEIFTAHADACVTPVLAPGEALADPHNVERATFVEVAGVVQPAPAPRLSRTPGRARDSAHISADDVLIEWSRARPD